MIFALFANMKKRQSFECVKEVARFLQKKNISVVTLDEEAESLGIQPLSSVSPSSINFLLSMGGDGTILRTIHHFPHLQAPIVGINLGHLGFMTDIPLSDLYPSLEQLLEGNFCIEERMMIEGVSMQTKRCHALNEIVFHRSKNPSLIDLSIHVDDTYLNTFSADGVIVSTPNGSTAYSLSSGGPILTPDLKALVITPICPHTISNKPIVLLPKKKIEIQYLNQEPLEVIYDGFSRFSLEKNETFTISISTRTFKIVNLMRTDYFTTLRTKLGWAGQVRYGNTHEID